MKEKCSRCGTEMPPNAPEGLCPRCLGALNLATETVLPGHQPATAQAPLPPAELAQHFPQLEILGYLGRGGMGVVYKARQKSLNRLVALKLLAPERVQDASFAERFAREAQALARLNHPNIVTIYDFGQAGGFYFLLMEFVDGLNLRQLLATRKLEPTEALAIVPPVCEALQYAHEHGIVHCDIKPENLLLDKNGRAKIADFGIARMLGAAPSQTAEIAGTPQYMAPEQRTEKTDHRADIYSLGVVLYELLTGELPGDKLQAPSRKVLIDVRLDEIVMRALQKTPELRFQTAGEFRTQLETVLNDPGAPPRPRPANAPPQMIKVGMTTVTTPERLGTFAGQLFHHRTKSHLMLDDRQLSFSRAGAMTSIPLSAIQDLSIGRYPGIMNPAGINFISVTYDQDSEAKRLFFTPYEGLFGFPSQLNAVIQEWFDEIQAAAVAATGRAPRTTPAEQLGVPSSSIKLLLLFAAFVVPAGVLAFSLFRVTGMKWPPSALFLGIFAAGFVAPFALMLVWRRRKRNGQQPGRLRAAVMVTLAVVGTIVGLRVLIVLTTRERPMGLTFVGFTNTSERTEALFWFTNRASPDLAWSVLKMSRRDPTGWAEEPSWTNGGQSRYTPLSSSGSVLPDYEDLDLIGLPVWTTNVPVQFVLEWSDAKNGKQYRGQVTGETIVQLTGPAGESAQNAPLFISDQWVAAPNELEAGAPQFAIGTAPLSYQWVLATNGQEAGVSPLVISEPFLLADDITSADMLQIRLSEAESELDRVTKLRAENLVSEQEMSQARFAVELVKAQLSGNPTQVAKVKLNQAELELDRVSKLHAEKLVTQHEMNQATFAVELRRAELAGDRAKVQRVRLAQAEDAFRRASKLRELNLISETEYSRAKTELELRRADAERLPNTPERPDTP